MCLLALIETVRLSPLSVDGKTVLTPPLPDLVDGGAAHFAETISKIKYK